MPGLAWPRLACLVLPKPGSAAPRATMVCRARALPFLPCLPCQTAPGRTTPRQYRLSVPWPSVPIGSHNLSSPFFSFGFYFLPHIQRIFENYLEVHLAIEPKS
jgi:hypothetical protein